MPNVPPRLPQPAPDLSPAARDSNEIRAEAEQLAARLVVGATTFVGGVRITRRTLLTYDVAGFQLDLDELGAEVAYLSLERHGFRFEATLRRAAEMTRTEQRGRFRVAIERYVGPTPIWEATWTSMSLDSTARDEAAALDALAARARDLGLSAERLGCHVVTPMPLAARPPLARTALPPSSTSGRVGAFTRGQRVLVHRSAHGLVVETAGLVERIRRDGCAWVALDERHDGVPHLHPWPCSDERSTWLLARAVDCEHIAHARAS